MKGLRYIVFLAIFLAVGFAAFLWIRPPNYKNLPPTATGDWIAFGDSLTAGTGAGPGNDYPGLLSEKLGRTIHNLGVPGNTTSDGLARIDRALELEPRVVLLCLGGNDGLRGLSAEAMFDNLGFMIDQFHERGSFVVLVGVRSASFRDKNESGFRKLAREKQVFYIPNILDGIIGRPNLMSDYIHPNEAGYQAIADRLFTELAPLLEQIDSR